MKGAVRTLITEVKYVLVCSEMCCLPVRRRLDICRAEQKQQPILDTKNGRTAKCRLVHILDPMGEFNQCFAADIE